MYKSTLVALNEEGYLEKKSNSQLDDKTENAGYRNWTKYARDLDLLGDFYNGRKNGYDWCDIFVDWSFIKAYGRELGQKLLKQPDKSTGAGCKYSMAFYRNAGQFYTQNPKEGDQIFFGPYRGSTDSSHTGLVYKVDANYVYTIEGNTSGASGVVPNGGGVCRKKYPLNSNYIVGYGRPNYSLVNDDGKTEGDEEEMTQEKFNEMMTEYLKTIAAEPASSWSAKERAWVEKKGLINGDGKGNRMWKKFVTREELSAILYRLFNT